MFQGLVPQWYDLADHRLAIADPRYYRSPETHPDSEVRELAREANEAAAMVLGSPVYHNSYSGALKNCLDYLAIQHFERKPVGLVSNGGSLQSVQACDHLRVVVRGVHGIATTVQVVSADRDFALVNGSYRLANRALVERIATFVAELIFFMDRLRHNDRDVISFLTDTESAPNVQPIASPGSKP
jgi:NAD(P)H-dependent FMN reductase